MKKLTIKEIKEMNEEGLKRMLTDEQYDRIKELGFTYIWELLEKMQDGAELSRLNDNEEYTTIEEYIAYLEDMKNQ